jgi:hypothetical protein
MQIESDVPLASVLGVTLHARVPKQHGRRRGPGPVPLHWARGNDRYLWSADGLVRAVPVPSAPAGENDAARADEDRFLARFAGLAALDRGQVAELVGWKFQAISHRKALAMRGIGPGRWDGRDGAPGAADLVRRALATSDDYEALATMATGAGGIYRFGPAMSSVVLAACRPERFTVAGSRALKTLRRLGLMPPGPPGFRLSACRTLAGQCGLSLGQVDRRVRSLLSGGG